MGKVFNALRSRRFVQEGPVGLHTMVLSTGVYLAEVNKFLTTLSVLVGRLDGADAVRVQEALEPVLDEYRNFETALSGFCSPKNAGRR